MIILNKIQQTGRAAILAAATLAAGALAYSCEEANKIPDITVPTSTYQVRGKVLSQVGLQPLYHIRVVLSVYADSMYLPENVSYVHQEIDESYTDKTGAFFVELETPPASYKLFYLKYIDIDGEENGHYAQRLDSVIFDNPTFSGGNPAINYSGYTLKDDIIVYLDTVVNVEY